MQTLTPTEKATFTHSGIPSGASVGVQVQNAAAGASALARTTSGVGERPLGSGNYVFILDAPVLPDVYLLIVDWSGGTLAPETSYVEEFRVSARPAAGSSDIGPIADYARQYLGSETWAALQKSGEVGPTGLAKAIEIVKARVFESPPAPGDEGGLPGVVLDYLGLLTALQLIPSARDYWAQQTLSKSVGNDPAELTTYVNRAALMDTLRQELLSRAAGLERAADPFVQLPIARTLDDGPQIDEDDWSIYATEDPRVFPPAYSFPYQPVERWAS